jgi:hypothetical protein
MNLLRKMALPAGMFFTLTAATALHAQDRMRAGMWENTVISSEHTITHNACLNAHDAETANGAPAVIRAALEKAIGGSCKLTDFKMDDNSKTETMVCGARITRNETTFHGGDSMDTTVTQTTGGVVKVSHIKGRRTGDCKAGD